MPGLGDRQAAWCSLLCSLPPNLRCLNLTKRTGGLKPPVLWGPVCLPRMPLTGDVICQHLDLVSLLPGRLPDLVKLSAPLLGASSRSVPPTWEAALCSDEGWVLESDEGFESQPPADSLGDLGQ